MQFDPGSIAVSSPDADAGAKVYDDVRFSILEREEFSDAVIAGIREEEIAGYVDS